MRRILIKEIERQKELMKLDEQLHLSPLLNLISLQKYFLPDKEKPSSKPVGKKGSFQDMVNTIVDKIRQFADTTPLPGLLLGKY